MKQKIGESIVYKIRYDDEADILTILIAEHGKLSHAEELGDIILYLDKDEKPSSSRY